MIHFKNKHITVFQSALFQTTSTVLETSEFILVVDPNWLPGEVEAIQHYVESIRRGRPLYLLFTHGDFDHVIGYRAFSDAKVIGSHGLVHHPKKHEKVQMIHDFDNENYIRRSYPVEFPEVDLVISEDGQQLEIGGTTLTFYLAPGHTHDGLFTIIEPLGIWITGDYLSDFELPFIYDSARAYAETLKKSSQVLEKHTIRVLIPGHGHVSDDHGEMKNRIERSATYLERLTSAVVEDDQVILAALEKEMPFSSNFTKQCHDDNVAIIRKEYIEK